MSAPRELPQALVHETHALAELLASVAGDEAEVIRTLARIGQSCPTPEDAAALCTATLIYTFARCITTETNTTNTKEKTA